MKVLLCNCFTKTPDIKYHKETCPYRLSVEYNKLEEELEYKEIGLKLQKKVMNDLKKENQKLKQVLEEIIKCGEEMPDETYETEIAKKALGGY